MFAILSSALSKIASGRGVLIIAMVAFAAGSSSAFYVSNKFDEADKYRAAEIALVAQRDAVQRAIDQSEQIRALDNDVLSELSSATADVRGRSDIFKREVEKYVEDNPACGLNNDALRLLNELRANGVTSVSELREAAEAATEAGGAIAIGQVDEVTAHGECITRYNELMHGNNALIEWIEKSNNHK